MKLAIPVWLGRVSPVFDVAGQLLVVDLQHGREVGRQEVALGEVPPEARISRLVELGVNTLVCGAISRPLEFTLAAAQINVIARVCGKVEDVLHAFCMGTLADDKFSIPGCCGRRRRFRGRSRRGGTG